MALLWTQRRPCTYHGIILGGVHPSVKLKKHGLSVDVIFRDLGSEVYRSIRYWLRLFLLDPPI